MSTWGKLEASFGGEGDMVTVESVQVDMPTGSESGPSVFEGGGMVRVSGRLRDVSDHDSPTILAWFLQHAQWAVGADLLWEIDGGPRYRYEWRDGELVKLKGVLDQ